jgi:LemA protein
MKTGSLALIIILSFILMMAGCGCNKYNSFTKGNIAVQNAWSNVETNYQRRVDLYNSVIKTIEGSANFEKSTLKEVIEARAQATSVKVDIDDSTSMQKFQQAQAQLQGSLSRLMAVSEAYPDLKTTKSFQDFQTQIEGTENRINVARRDYNEAVSAYNLQVQQFPGNIFAGLFHFQSKPFYKADAGSDKAPDIQFNIK